MLIDSNSKTPIFRQIVQHIYQAIESGFYQPGEALPSQRVLAANIRVTPNTIQRAFEELERRGIIESRRGVGVFVIDVKRVPNGIEERATAKLLKRCIQSGLKAKLEPTRIRQLFEAEMCQQMIEQRGQH